MTETTVVMITVPRDLIVRIYRLLDAIEGSGLELSEWTDPFGAPEAADLYLELGAIVNPEGKDAREI